MTDQSSSWDGPPSIEDIERILATMAPPSTLSAAIENLPEIHAAFVGQDPIKLVSAFAGMSTDPQFQANGCRLDWATRFGLVLARGRKSLRSRWLSDVLNKMLDQARINVLEDPIESVFAERISTSGGDRLLITGLWENAGFHTECVIRAFESLPSHALKEDALRRAYALLALGHEIARRSGVIAKQIGSGTPNGTIAVPSDVRIRTLGRRIRFSFDDLERLGVDIGDIEPYILPEDAADILLDTSFGNSPLEFMPIIRVQDGILVASPPNLTTALRADLISTALDNNMSEGLRTALLFTHADMLETTHFFGSVPARVFTDGGVIRREVVWQQPSGYWVHIIQLVDDLQGWPQAAFGSVARLDDNAVCTLNHSIHQARKFCLDQPAFVEGITVLIVGGVGRGFAIDNRLELDGENWASLVLCPSDAFAMGLVEDGKFNDIWRLVKLDTMTRELGFEIQSVNGWLNLFQWWKNNKLKLIPEHFIDLEPPGMVSFDTDLLFQARLEATEAADFRTLFHPALGYRRVTRKSRSPKDADYDCLYIDIEADEQRIPRAAVCTGRAVWWIELELGNHEGLPEVIFRTWDGIVHWAARCQQHLAKLFDVAGEPMRVQLVIDPVPEDDVDVPPSRSPLECVDLEVDAQTGACRIHLAAEWHKHLFRSDNVAELHVAGRLIEAFFRLSGLSLHGVDCNGLALEAVGSTEYRWRHVAPAITPIEQLKQLGLAGSFREISRSAGALVQFGTCWEIRDRSDGARIHGYEECAEFVRRYYDHMVEKLVRRLREYDRRALLGFALSAFQAAEGELSHWSMTAKAMRAIHGAEADHLLSMEHRSKAYGVLRATSVITEVGLCEAGKDGSRMPGHLDFDELQALAIMVFEMADLLAGIRLNRIEPKIHISPTGEILSNHDFEEQTIQATGMKVNLQNRLMDADRYDLRFENRATQEPAEAFREAVSAEFGTSWEGVIDLGIATAHIAAERGSGVFEITRSELLTELEKFEPMEGVDVGPAIDRLTMGPRKSWQEIPNGWSANDIDLGRLGRRYAPISQPIVALDTSEDPELLICPAAIFRSVMYMFQGAMDGSLQNEYWRSTAMQRYSSAAGNASGNRFNEKVAEALTSIGYEAHAGVKPSWCLNIKATEEVTRLGDVDCLALDRGTNTVWVIEAKDLRLCKTLGEAARRLSEYQGKNDHKGRPDKLRRHLLRVEFIRERADLLCGRLRLDAPPRIRGIVVIRSPQPLDGIWIENGDDARVVMLDELPSVLAG